MSWIEIGLAAVSVFSWIRISWLAGQLLKLATVVKNEIDRLEQRIDTLEHARAQEKRDQRSA